MAAFQQTEALTHSLESVDFTYKVNVGFENHKIIAFGLAMQNSAYDSPMTITAVHLELTEHFVQAPARQEHHAAREYHDSFWQDLMPS